MLGVSAWYLLKGRHIELAKRSMTVAASFGLAAALSVVVLGDESGYLTTRASEDEARGHGGDLAHGACARTLHRGRLPRPEGRETHYAVEIPWVGGLIDTRSLNTPVEGIEELVERAKGNIAKGVLAYDALQKIRAAGSAAVPADVQKTFEANGNLLGYALLLKRYVDDPRQATPEQIAKAAWDTVPQVAPLFWTFRIMVGVGFFMILLMATFFTLSARASSTASRCCCASPFWRSRCRGSRRMRLVRRRVRPAALDHRGHPAHRLGGLHLGAMTVLLTIAGFVLIYTTSSSSRWA